MIKNQMEELSKKKQSEITKLKTTISKAEKTKPLNQTLAQKKQNIEQKQKLMKRFYYQAEGS